LELYKKFGGIKVISLIFWSDLTQNPNGLVTLQKFKSSIP